MRGCVTFARGAGRKGRGAIQDEARTPETKSAWSSAMKRTVFRFKIMVIILEQRESALDTRRYSDPMPGSEHLFPPSHLLWRFVSMHHPLSDVNVEKPPHAS